VGRAIFISYRRDDTEGEAGRLFDDLVRTFGDDSVFMDVAGINPGIDFRKAIDDNVATCGVLLAVIGPQWGTITNGSGHRRLDDENDFVRLEIASALQRNVAVIPVLVHDAKIPHPDQLPDNLKDLAYRNSVEITHARWNSDVQLLTNALGKYIASSSSTDTAPVHATVPVQLPAPNAPEARPAAAPASKTPLIAGIAVVALLLIGAVAFFAFRSSGGAGSAATSATAASGAYRGLEGTWTNPSAEGHNGLAKLEITGAGNQLSMHAWGDCPECDWGTQAATVDGQKATAVWSFAKKMGGEAEGRVATVTVAPAGDKLNVKIANTYPSRAPTERKSDFVREK